MTDEGKAAAVARVTRILDESGHPGSYHDRSVITAFFPYWTPGHLARLSYDEKSVEILNIGSEGDVRAHEAGLAAFERTLSTAGLECGRRVLGAGRPCLTVELGQALLRDPQRFERFHPDAPAALPDGAPSEVPVVTTVELMEKAKAGLSRS